MSEEKFDSKLALKLLDSWNTWEDLQDVRHMANDEASLLAFLVHCCREEGEQLSNLAVMAFSLGRYIGITREAKKEKEGVKRDN